MNYYLGMAYGFLHIFELIFLAFFFIYFRIMIKKIDTDSHLIFKNKIKLVLFIFIFCVFIINLYILYDTLNLKFHVVISPTMEGIKLFFDGFKERFFPYLLSQLFVVIICFIFYLWVYFSEKRNWKHNS